MIYKSIDELIGNTPLLEISPKIHGLKHIKLYAKLELFNPFGSVKDRVAKSMLDPILVDLKAKDKTVVEASSGNTAKALSILSGINGLKFKTVTNRIKMPEVRMILQALGSEIEELPGLSDCPDPMDPDDFTTVAANLAISDPDKYHYTDQYFNELNLEAHKQTGREIYQDLNKVDYFFGFLGTCGTTIGAGSVLKEKCDTKIIGVVADAGHHIPGGRNINELWEVGFFRKDFYNELIQGNTTEAIEGMLELNRKVGILGGPTSGLIYYTALQKLREIDSKLQDGEQLTAVFIVCDRMEPYMSYLKKYTPELFSTHTSSKLTVNKINEEDLKNSKSITPQDLETKLKSTKPPLVVDIRGNFAFTIGHILGSLNILDELFTQMIEQGNTLPKDKEVVIICSIGKISPKYATFLNKQGYQAYSLDGGINNYKKQGFELQKIL